jgi:hypothetical protein
MDELCTFHYSPPRADWVSVSPSAETTASERGPLDANSGEKLVNLLCGFDSLPAGSALNTRARGARVGRSSALPVSVVRPSLAVSKCLGLGCRIARIAVRS